RPLINRPRQVSVLQQQSQGRRPGEHWPSPQPQLEQPPLPPKRPAPHEVHPTCSSPPSPGMVGIGFTPSSAPGIVTGEAPGVLCPRASVTGPKAASIRTIAEHSRRTAENGWSFIRFLLVHHNRHILVWAVRDAARPHGSFALQGLFGYRPPNGETLTNPPNAPE